ncbi:thiamine phosphate synthase [Vibrio salinus]|uniref:thiamine phosphate synthase n=1 Tax=Vibrio salinus TaxID=2899784 RepID=UPI001E53BDCC|nr:thiamine phosphate synthase [Vibrio salinus]MCE0493601.1 thiamine phosphate synthase [Vibrio salinus]
MITIWLPEKEKALMSTLQRILDSVFRSTLEEVCIELRTWEQLALNIQFSDSYHLGFDVYLDEHPWLFSKSSGADIGSRKLHHSINYTQGFVSCDLLSRPLTASVCIGNVDIFQPSDSWLDCCGKLRTLYSRDLPLNVVEPVEHLSWLVLLLAYEFSFDDSLTVARAAMNVSRGTWPDNIQKFPSIINKPASEVQPFLNIESDKMGLYPVVDSFQWVEKLVAMSGIDTVQLRIKDRTHQDLREQIKLVSDLAKETGAQLFINDHWEEAIDSNAYGVHLGQEDITIADLDWIRESKLRLGVSTHGYYEILTAEAISPSYIALGHIFPTTTKSMPSQPQGVIRLEMYQKLIDSIAEIKNPIPTVAIGGIDLNNCKQVIKTGVNSIAVVRAITQAKDLPLVVEQFKSLFDCRKSEECVG